MVYGAGAIGGVVGAHLFQHDNGVSLIARGAHHDVLRSQGLRIQDPSGESGLCQSLWSISHPGSAGSTAMSARRDEEPPQPMVFAELAATAPPELPVVCLQNGVRNEPEALRRFAKLYGVPVACPTAHLAGSGACLLDAGHRPPRCRPLSRRGGRHRSIGWLDHHHYGQCRFDHHRCG